MQYNTVRLIAPAAMVQCTVQCSQCYGPNTGEGALARLAGEPAVGPQHRALRLMFAHLGVGRIGIHRPIPGRHCVDGRALHGRHCVDGRALLCTRSTQHHYWEHHLLLMPDLIHTKNEITDRLEPAHCQY